MEKFTIIPFIPKQGGDKMSIRRSLRHNNLCDDLFIESALREVLSDRDMFNSEEIGKLSEITGLNLNRNITFEEIMSYYRDNGKSNQDVFDYFLESVYSNQEKFNNFDFYVSQDFNTENIRVLSINLLISSLLYLCTFSKYSISSIHQKIFGEKLKSHEGKNRDVNESKTIKEDFVNNLTSLNVFIPKGVINTPYASSIINYIFDIDEIYDMSKIFDITKTDDIIDIKNLRKILNLVAPDSYKIIRTYIKNKSNFRRIIEKGLISALPKSVLRIISDEFQNDNTFRTYIHLFALIAVMEYKQDDFVLLFDSEMVLRDLHLNLNLNTDISNGKFQLAETLFPKKMDSYRILSNRLLREIVSNESSSGIVSLENLISNYYLDENLDNKDIIEFPHTVLLDVVSECQRRINNTNKNKKETIKKLCDGDEISADTAREIAEQISERLVGQCQFIRIANKESKYMKSIKLREAFKIVNAILPTSTEISLNHIKIKSLKNTLSFAPQLINFLKENDLVEEFIFLVLSMLNTAVFEYTFINSEVVNNSTFSKILDKFSLNEEHDKLQDEVLELKTQLTSYQEQLESSGIVVHKEVDRITKQLRADNARLEKEIIRTQEENKELSNKYTESQTQLEEANRIIIEMIEEADSKDETDITEMINFLKTKRVSFLGGYPVLIHHLRNYLPNISILYKEGPSVNLKSLEHYDVNIVYSQNISHSFSYSMKSNTSFGNNFLMIEKRIGAKQIIKRAYDHIVNGPKPYTSTETVY